MNLRTFLRQCQEAEVMFNVALSSHEFDQFEPEVLEAVLSKAWLQICVDLGMKKEDVQDLVADFYDKYSSSKINK